MSSGNAKEAGPLDFIRQIVRDDVAAGKHGGAVVTRFPPHPNGTLHVGHAKAVCVSFSIAAEYGGRCHLRFDDTNPSREDVSYVEAIQQDVRWLGFDWGEHLYFTSDYFGRLHEYAVDLIGRGLAFVCDLTPEEIAKHRGSLTEPGRNSPHRNRTLEENLELFEGMRAGRFEAGSRVLRAKIDMASPVLPMRDPILYRIQRTRHHRTGDDWVIYPMYDFAHCLSDAIEGVTHSLCSLEFADHRPLYDWLLEALEVPHRPQQIEFARLNLSHTLMSKRLLRQLVEEHHVSGWDDPRMSTVAGLRRRGVPPEAVREFVEGVGLARRDNIIELARLEFSVREVLNRSSPRAMGVLRPLRVVIENYPEDEEEEFEASNHPQDPSFGTRPLPFSRELYIERDDFMEDPPGKFYRLAPGREVRLRYAYLVTCTEVIHDANGQVSEVRCRYDPATRGGDAPDGRKVKGTIHWVSARHATRCQVREYGVLFDAEDPADVPEGGNFKDGLNPHSLVELEGCFVEPSLADAAAGDRFQFERQGYFCVDPDGEPGALVFNRTVTLRDAWAKIAKRGVVG